MAACQAAIVALASVVALVVVAWRGPLLQRGAETPRRTAILRDENLTLQGRAQVHPRAASSTSARTLDRVERFDQKLRAITLLSDPQRNLAMGPTETEPRHQVPTAATTQFARPQATETPKALIGKLDKLSAEATRQEQSLQELQAYFQDQKSLLASTPSVWPARGWVTSRLRRSGSTRTPPSA